MPAYAESPGVHAHSRLLWRAGNYQSGTIRRHFWSRGCPPLESTVRNEVSGSSATPFKQQKGASVINRGTAPPFGHRRGHPNRQMISPKRIIIPRDSGANERAYGQVIFRLFGPADEQVQEADEPGMRALHDLAAGLSTLVCVQAGRWR